MAPTRAKSPEMAEIGPNTRLRVSPYYEATVKEGVKAFSPYNKMLMPVSYGDPDAEYDRLMTGVAQWDVAIERQVQITGPDAARLVQMLCARDLSRCKVGQGKYVPMCDHRGVLLNDPVVLKLAEDRFWISIADENIRMWSRAIARERGMNVEIVEPDVSPMALQGPKAEEVVAAVMGDWIRDIRFFWFADAEVQGIPVKIQRSGYSKQGGFEIYLMDGARGVELWNIFREAGAPWGIGPGTPNPMERVEVGMLSYGGDTDDDTDPFEAGLGAFVDLDLDDEVIGIKALRRIAETGPRRHLIGVKLVGLPRETGHQTWFDTYKDGQKVGSMTNGVWSPRAQCMIGFLLVDKSVVPGDRVEIARNGRRDIGEVSALPFFQ